MAKNFDHGRPQVYFTSNFLKNHVLLCSTGGKKKAENVFLRRGRDISTVLCLTRLELVHLAGEIHRRQGEFSRRPSAIFTTQHGYDYWKRGGPQAKDKQRATPGNGRFRYAVRMNDEGIYTVCHFHGTARRV
jgi:hypothetical protein